MKICWFHKCPRVTTKLMSILCCLSLWGDSGEATGKSPDTPGKRETRKTLRNSVSGQIGYLGIRTVKHQVNVMKPVYLMFERWFLD